MKHAFTISIIIALLAFGPLQAQGQSLPTTWPGPDAAQVSGVLGEPGKELFGVRFTAIDGRNISPRDSLWLEPGTYTLKVAIDAAHVRRPPQYSSRFRREDPSYNEIELELEAGRTYEIRARYDRSDRDQPYSIVLHQILQR